MRTLLAVGLLTFILAQSASAQNTYRMKEKARSLGAKINERDNAALNDTQPAGESPKNGAAPAPAAAIVPVAPPKPASQQAAATKLKADLAAIRLKGEVTPEAKKQFLQDLQASAMGTGRPTAKSLQAFAESFLPAVASKKFGANDDSKLVHDIVLSLNCGGLAASRTQEITSEVETTLTKAGTDAAAAAKSSADLATIIAEVQAGAIR